MNFFVEYLRQFGRFQRNARLYLVNTILSGVTTGILLVLYNLYLISLGYQTNFVGLVLFVGTIGGGIAIFPAGYCVDRFRAKPILILSNLVIALAGTGQILFRQPLPLLASSFLVGAALAFVLVINAPFLTRNSAPEERAQLFSANIAVGLITLVLGEMLGGALPPWFSAQPWLMAPLPSWLSSFLASQPEPRSYQLALLLAGLIAAPSLVPLFMLREPDSTPSILVPGQGQALGMRHTLAVIRQTDIRSLASRLTRTPFFFLTLVYTLTALGAGLVVPYFNVYFVVHLKASSTLFGLIDGGANAATALLTLAAPWLAARIGRISTVVLTRLLSIPLLLVIGLTGMLPLAALLYPMRQGMMDMSNGVLQVYAMEAVEERHRGMANSAYQAAMQVPWALTASLGGSLIVYLGYAPLFLCTATCYALALGLLWVRFLTATDPV